MALGFGAGAALGSFYAEWADVGVLLFVEENHSAILDFDGFTVGFSLGLLSVGLFSVAEAFSEIEGSAEGFVEFLLLLSVHPTRSIERSATNVIDFFLIVLLPLLVRHLFQYRM